MIAVATPEQLDEVRTLIREYLTSLDVDLCLDDFAGELNGLIRIYDPILVSTAESGLSGCVALRPLTESIGEMKRLYVRPQFRGLGLGRRLTEAIIEEARRKGYQSLRLDTLPHLQEAIALYRRLGFRDIPRYNTNDIPGVFFLELRLY